MLEFVKNNKAFVIILAAVALCFIVVFNYFFAEKLELVAYDLRVKERMKPADPDIVIVAIDDETINIAGRLDKSGLGRYPWPRTAYSKVINYINKGNPAAIIVDINLEGKYNTTHAKFSDNSFYKELAGVKNLFFVQALNKTRKTLMQELLQHNPALAQMDVSIQDKLLDQATQSISKMKNGLKSPEYIRKFFHKVQDNTLNDSSVQDYLNYYMFPVYIEEVYRLATAIGINDSFADTDNTVRTYQPVYRYDTKYLFSIALEVVYSLSEKKWNIILNKNKLTMGNKTIPLNDKSRFYINWRTEAPFFKGEKNYFDIQPNMHYKSIQFIRLFEQKDRTLTPDIFKDKIVIIGNTSSIGHDVVQAPNQPNFFGVEILATAIDNLINNDNFMIKASNWINMFITALLCSLVILLFFLKRDIYSAIAWSVVALFIFCVANIVLFAVFSIWIDLVPPVVDAMTTMVFMVLLSLVSEKLKRYQLEFTFSKYVSPQIYNTLLSDSTNVSLNAKRMNITILFSDIRGFTTFTEGLDPEEVASYLNKYFTAMVKVIMDNNGTVDKFMGDAIMAFFGAPVEDKDHALWAVKTALGMKTTLDKLNDQWRKQDKRTLNIGIGLNSGNALVGNFGSSELMDFTTIGDSVNLASRLETLNKEENTNILISAFTYQLVKDEVNVRVIGPRIVKGKSEAVVVYELLGLKDSSDKNSKEPEIPIIKN